MSTLHVTVVRRELRGRGVSDGEAVGPARLPRGFRSSRRARNIRGTDGWQVFGLTSAPAGPASYCPPLPSPTRASARGGGRSRLPLRGSPGIRPGSLFRLRTLVRGTSTGPRYGVGFDRVNHILRSGDADAR